MEVKKMAKLKLFECSVFNPGVACTYSVTGEEDPVVDQAINHEINEHGFDDSPQLRQDISRSLIDVGSDNDSGS